MQEWLMVQIVEHSEDGCEIVFRNDDGEEWESMTEQ
jgi:hypothetical protein